MKISYLGYILENGNVTPCKNKTKAIRNFLTPKDIKTIQSFLSLAGFRKFVTSYATIAHSLRINKKECAFSLWR